MQKKNQQGATLAGSHTANCNLFQVCIMLNNNLIWKTQGFQISEW
jgi:hypothetical protein